MSWHLNVPKILHVYWSATPMPYLRYLTVVSFMKYNPDWEVILWLPKYPYKVITWETKELNYSTEGITDYFPNLLKLPIQINYVNLKDFGQTNEMSEVHKSDFLRYWILTTYGGVYSDMDILYFRSIEALHVNSIDHIDKETFVCISPRYGHSAGFYMAAKGSLYFKEMFRRVTIDPGKYQSVGPDAVNKEFPTVSSINKISPAVDIGMAAVYMHDAKRVRIIYKSARARFAARSIGCHWYGGDPLSGKFLNETDGGRINLPNNILTGILIKKNFEL